MEKLTKLRNWFLEKGQGVVAFSGGVDSSLVLKVGYDILGDKLLAVTATSILNKPEELATARRVAEEIGVKRHIILEFKDLENPQVKANAQDRCYHCKKARFQAILAYAKEQGIPYVFEGSNIDDLADYRPGLKAIKEQGVYSPLQEVGLTKGEIRELSRDLGLSVWDKPSEPCLATRFPTDTVLEENKIIRVYQGEAFLKELGLKQVRLRDHGNLARLEVEDTDLLTVLEKREVINKELIGLGYRYVTLDLVGYRTGSMNL